MTGNIGVFVGGQRGRFMPGQLINTLGSMWNLMTSSEDAKKVALTLECCEHYCYYAN